MLDLQHYDFLKDFYMRIKALRNQRLRNYFYQVSEEPLLCHESEREAVTCIFGDRATEYSVLNNHRCRCIGRIKAECKQMGLKFNRV